MLQLAQNILLSHDVFLLIFLDDVLLLQHFHCVDLAIYFASNKKDFSVGALSDHGYSCIIIYRMTFHLIRIIIKAL
jgi:hypothetical protein